MWRLVARCPPLDANSRYCNLIQATHFGGTSIVAEKHEVLRGFISGHLLPERPDTLFVWQVAVGEEARGQGVGLKMLQLLLARLPNVKRLETTVTEENLASKALFERFAASRGAVVEKSVMFAKEAHFEGEHDDEILLSIGPFAAGSPSPAD